MGRIRRHRRPARLLRPMLLLLQLPVRLRAMGHGSAGPVSAALLEPRWQTLGQQLGPRRRGGGGAGGGGGGGALPNRLLPLLAVARHAQHRCQVGNPWRMHRRMLRLSGVVAVVGSGGSCWRLRRNSCCCAMQAAPLRPRHAGMRGVPQRLLRLLLLPGRRPATRLLRRPSRLLLPPHRRTGLHATPCVPCPVASRVSVGGPSPLLWLLLLPMGCLVVRLQLLSGAALRGQAIAQVCRRRQLPWVSKVRLLCLLRCNRHIVGIRRRREARLLQRRPANLTSPLLLLLLLAATSIRIHAVAYWHCGRLLHWLQHHAGQEVVECGVIRLLAAAVVA